MKVPAAFRDANGEWKVNGDQELNFGRVMRVTVYHIGTDEETQKEVLEQAVMEFAPMKDSRLCPRMEATINDIRQPQQTAGKPGFTAEIKLFNASDAVKTLLAKHQNFILDYTKSTQAEHRLANMAKKQPKELEQYYADRARVSVECGYWNPDQGDNGIADYHLLFDGFINSSLQYLSGHDLITHLYCHDFVFGDLSNKAVMESLGLKFTPQAALKWQGLSREEREKRSGKGMPSWHTLAGKLCRNFLPTRIRSFEQKDGTVSYMQSRVTESERKSHDWFAIRYIYSPQRKDEINIDLETRMTSAAIDVSNFMTNSSTYQGILNDLCNYANAGVSYQIDTNYDKKKVIVWIYPRGAEYIPANSETSKGKTIRIVNYQNLIVPPAVSANGSLTIKMFLNWEASPDVNIELALDQSVYGDGSDDDRLLVAQSSYGQVPEVIANGGKISPYMASQQGANSASVYTLQYGTDIQKNHGYMFNLPFPIIKTKHEVSTHEAAWHTTVVTVPKYTGLEL